MSEYEVIVTTTVLERYYVQADSPEDARMKWTDEPGPESSECIAVDDVTVKEVEQ